MKYFFIKKIYFRELYITDGRYMTFFKNPYSQWTLQLKFVNERDSGLYECAAVSKTLSFVLLHKIEISLSCFKKNY